MSTKGVILGTGITAAILILATAADYSDFISTAEPVSTGTSPTQPDGTGLSMAPPVQSTPDPALKSAALASLQRLPMMFEENRGQLDPQSSFLSRGQGYTIALAEGGVATLGLRNGGEDGATAVIKMSPFGGRFDAKADGIDIQEGKRHYYKGSDPADWVVNVPLYDKVAYQDVYPGIDLVYYGNPQLLEYDFVIAPGVDPSVISLAFEGARSITIGEAEELVLSLNAGELVLKAPLSYQERNGKRIEVASRYVMEESGRVAFSVGAYDASLPLVIDPVIVYSTLIGGSESDYSEDIALDNTGNIYVTGSTYYSEFSGIPDDFPVTGTSTHNGLDDAFVVKLSPTGAMIFSTVVGGDSFDLSRGIAVDSKGHSYITGTTSSVSDVNHYPVTDGSKPAGGTDVFITELSANGALHYSTLIGGNKDDIGNGISLDSSGSIYITGKTWDSSTDYPVTDDSTHNGSTDVFVTKISSARSLVYSTLIGGTFGDVGNDIAVDKSEHVYITGFTQDAWETLTDYPVTDNSTHSGNNDIFVTKLFRHGGIAYSTLIGGSNLDNGNGIALDDNGNIYVAGYTRSPDYPVSNFSGLKGPEDAIITRLSPAGVRTFSSYIGGSGSDSGNDIAVDSVGKMHLTGETHSADYLTTDGSRYIGGALDVFVTKVGDDGSVTFSTLIGSGLEDVSTGIKLDGSGNIYITGHTQNAFTTYPVTDNSTHHGSTDIFVTKLSPTPDRASLVAPSGNWTNSPTYTWDAVPNATWYYLWVDDSEKNAVSQWYRASEVGCESGTLTCSIDPSIALTNGDARWWVRTWSPVGYGVWSEGESFNVQ